MLAAFLVGPLFTCLCWDRRLAPEKPADEGEGHARGELMLARIQERQTAVVLERSRVAGGDAATGTNACAGFWGALPAQQQTAIPMAANNNDLPEAIPWAPAAATAPPAYPIAAPVTGGSVDSQKRQLSVE